MSSDSIKNHSRGEVFEDFLFFVLDSKSEESESILGRYFPFPFPWNEAATLLVLTDLMPSSCLLSMNGCISILVIQICFPLSMFPA